MLSAVVLASTTLPFQNRLSASGVPVQQYILGKILILPLQLEGNYPNIIAITIRQGRVPLLCSWRDRGEETLPVSLLPVRVGTGIERALW